MIDSKWRIFALGLVILMVLSTAVGCASTTTIDSDPQGATVTINGQHVGTTPVQYTDSATIMARHTVVLEKPGYETSRATLRRDGDINVGAAVAAGVGFITCIGTPLLVSLLWVLEYPEYNEYALQAQGASQQQPEVHIEDDTITFHLVPRQDTEVASRSCGW